MDDHSPKVGNKYSASISCKALSAGDDGSVGIGIYSAFPHSVLLSYYSCEP